MKHLYWPSLGTLLVVSCACPTVHAQDITNTGTTIALTGGALLFTSGSLTNSSGTLDLSTGSNQLMVGGNLVNASGATLTPGTSSTVTLNGAAAQQLSLNGATLANLTINNTSGGVSLPASSNVRVASVLTLTSGIVNVDPSSTLLLLNGAMLSGEQNTSYVKGPLAAVKANLTNGVATVFPNSFTITPNVPLTALTVTRTAGLRTAQTSYGTNASGSNKGIDRIWQTSTAVTGQVMLSWLSDNDNGLRNLAQSRPWAQAATPVAGSSWALVGASQDASSLRSVQATIPANSSFSFFTVSTTEAPLPVTLVTFTAERQRTDALLNWTTASELNNAYFQVESSADGTAFQTLGQVAGAGTSSRAHAYQYVDAGLARYGTPLVYYRLRQMDQDGTSTYSPVRMVPVVLASGLLVQAYPNPSQQQVSLTIHTSQAGPATLLLTDVLGQQLSQQPLTLDVGTTVIPLPAASQLATGVYLVHVQQGSLRQTLKLVRQ